MDLTATLKDKEKEIILQGLKDFINLNASSFSIPSLNSAEKQSLAWHNLIDVLKDESFSVCHSKCLEALKILSRSNQYLDSIIDTEILDALLVHAGLLSRGLSPILQHSEDISGISESQKCIFNLVFNHTKSRETLSKGCMADAILQRLNAETLDHSMFAIYLFDLKILFILTAKCDETRLPLRHRGGLKVLTTLLEKFVSKETLSDEEVDLCIETMRILFNLLLPDKIIQSETQDAEDDTKLQSMLVKMTGAILAYASSSTRVEELKSQAVNLLLNISPECYEQIIPTESEKENYLGHDMTLVGNLVMFLESRLEQPTRLLEEKLVSILSVLIQCSKTLRPIRKFLRAKILPPLRDVSQRPEEGDSLRSKLCRLMTSPITRVEYMVAELLFVLCKENVGRLIKYTGYGNAAGLLAHRGLMMGQKAGHKTPYSSDSDSDTEEYKKAEPHINPVTGAYEPKRPNPTEHMTEEQKEYEAVRLINIMDQLQRQGIIQPAKIGEDGKPQPIEHVLELQKDLDN